MITLRELLLPEVAAKKRVAVLFNAVSEVLTRHADALALPLLQLALVNESPFHHGHLLSTSVLLQECPTAQQRGPEKSPSSPGQGIVVLMTKI